MENSDNTTRNSFNAIVSEKDLVEYYWPAFQSCVERAHAGSIMCSYNAGERKGVRGCADVSLLIKAPLSLNGLLCPRVPIDLVKHSITRINACLFPHPLPPPQ